jgi:hypothetical protein
MFRSDYKLLRFILNEEPLVIGSVKFGIGAGDPGERDILDSRMS